MSRLSTLSCQGLSAQNISKLPRPDRASYAVMLLCYQFQAQSYTELNIRLRDYIKCLDYLFYPLKAQYLSSIRNLPNFHLMRSDDDLDDTVKEILLCHDLIQLS